MRLCACVGLKWSFPRWQVHFCRSPVSVQFDSLRNMSPCQMQEPECERFRSNIGSHGRACVACCCLKSSSDWRSVGLCEHVEASTQTQCHTHCGAGKITEAQTADSSSLSTQRRLHSAHLASPLRIQTGSSETTQQHLSHQLQSPLKSSWLTFR